jgi:hypothetical protein
MVAVSAQAGLIQFDFTATANDSNLGYISGNTYNFTLRSVDNYALGPDEYVDGFVGV